MDGLAPPYRYRRPVDRPPVKARAESGGRDDGANFCRRLPRRARRAVYDRDHNVVLDLQRLATSTALPWRVRPATGALRLEWS